MKEGTVGTMRRPREPKHDIQRTVGEEQSGIRGYIDRRDGFIPKTLLQAIRFRSLVSAETSVHVVVCEGKVVRGKQNTIFSSTMSGQTTLAVWKAFASIALTRYVFVHEPHPKPG